MGLALLRDETAQPAAARAFDFWLGEWDCTWPDGGRGTNSVYSDFNGRVVVENFDGRPSLAFQGMSVSVYDARADAWRQTWVDSEGNYLEFSGGPTQGAAMELRRRDHGGVLWRMVWCDVTRRGFEWRYERSEDGGSSWTTVWPISYRRVV